MTTTPVTTPREHHRAHGTTPPRRRVPGDEARPGGAWLWAVMVAAWCGGVAGSTGCRTPTTTTAPATRRPAAIVVDVGGGLPVVRVRGDGGADVDALARAVPAAAARLQRAGLRWQVPVDVVVHANVRAFVAATGQTTPTLRAWTTWSTVHLLPRWTWRLDDDDATVARLTHELCHAALHQRHPDATTAERRRAPRFVTEGVCSVVAGQSRERAARDDVRRAVARGDRVDFDDDPAFAYAYAHHVFAAVEACGVIALVDVVDRTGAGARVEDVLGPPAAWLEGCPADRTPTDHVRGDHAR